MEGRAPAVCFGLVRVTGGWWPQGAGQGSRGQGLVLGAVGLEPRGLYWGAGLEAQPRLPGSGACVTSQVCRYPQLGAWMWLELCGGRDRTCMVQTVETLRTVPEPS